MRARTHRSLSLFLALLAIVAGTLVPASADPTVDLGTAKANREAAQAAVRELSQKVDALTAAYRASQSKLEAATVDVLGAYRQRLVFDAQLAAAQELLDRQAASAYENGPGMSLDVVLGSTSPGDLASVEIYTEKAMGVSSVSLERVRSLRESIAGVTAELDRRQEAVATTTRELESLAQQALADLAHAQDMARAAGLVVNDLQRQQQALAAAQAAAFSTIQGLIDAKRGLDQSALLALLGPNAGRGCEIPPGLEDTGQRMSGISSWYGWELAGHPTATGAIFDPRLFTAANKELPLNSFLRVHFNARCAIVLVNDRGPYKPGRVFDLSQAAAEYLGVGLNYVTADVLVPL